MGEMYDVVNDWRRSLYDELLVVAPDLARHFDHYNNAMSYFATQDRREAKEEAAGDLYKMIIDLEEMIEGEFVEEKVKPGWGLFEDPISEPHPIVLVYDGVSLYDKPKPDKLITPKEGSMPDIIMQAFYADSSIKVIRADEVIKHFDVETFRKWQGKLAAIFGCSKDQIRSVIYRKGRQIFITERMEIIRRP